MFPGTLRNALAAELAKSYEADLRRGEYGAVGGLRGAPVKGKKSKGRAVKKKGAKRSQSRTSVRTVERTVTTTRLGGLRSFSWS